MGPLENIFPISVSPTSSADLVTSVYWLEVPMVQKPGVCGLPGANFIPAA